METTNIKKYLDDDTVFQKMNKFISLDPSSEKKINNELNLILEDLTSTMKSLSPLFRNTYQRRAYTGSYYKKTRVGTPNEFDLNLLINLPLKREDFEEFTTDLPGFTKIRIKQGIDVKALRALKYDEEAFREMQRFIDSDLYLNQNKFREWMEGILGKVTNYTNKEIILKNISYPVCIKRKSGPAFTLSFTPPFLKYPIDIDLVPALAFSILRQPPPELIEDPILNNKDKYWYAVPKPLYRFESHHYWRLSLYELEKDLLDEYSHSNRMKPIIRHLKKFRDTQNLSNFASYYIETLCLHEREFFRNSRESCTSLFFTMLQILCQAFETGYINFYWVDGVNLLDKMNIDEKTNICNKLRNIIKKIEKNIKENKFAIAEHVLPEHELAVLRNDLVPNCVQQEEWLNEFTTNEQIDEENAGNQGTSVII